MNDLDRIEHLLKTKALNHDTFERCAQDLLSPVFPGLTPIPGGSDWGRDADVAVPSKEVPPRIMITRSKSYEGIRKNMLGGIKSLRAHDKPFERIILANPGTLNNLQRQKLVDAAKAVGASLDSSNIFDCGFFANSLRRDGYWRETLLGLSSQPVTLLDVPVDLETNPGLRLSLVGRAEELESLEGAADLILSGMPGAGKSRLLVELSGAVFVDTDADYEQIARDLRWLTPATVVVDDAGDNLELVRRLRAIRSAESDILSFRIIAVCWPDEEDRVASALGTQEVLSLSLLERHDMNQLLLDLGIKGDLARREILNQAEGRPGWAVSLGTLLLSARDASTIINGRALLGAVTNYLLRARAERETIGLLAHISALGGIMQHELAALSAQSGLSVPRVAELMTRSAKGGLLDVQNVYSWEHRENLRQYQVRPPMLAYALVAEVAFSTEVPHIDLDRLAHDWPSRLEHVALAAIRSAALGAPGARGVAARLFGLAITSDGLDHRAKYKISDEYLSLDESAAAEVLQIVQASLASAVEEGNVTGDSVEPLSGLSGSIASHYHSADALRMLLDLACLDERRPNSNPQHPLRQIEDLLSTFHPELPLQADLRPILTRVLSDWLTSSTHPRRWMVAGGVVEALLSFTVQGAFSDPGDPRQLQLFNGVLPPEAMRAIYEDVWPIVRAMIDRDHHEIGAAVIDALSEWLRIGGGFERPFGNEQPASRIEQAHKLAVSLLEDLAEISNLSIGLRMRIRELAARFDRIWDVQLDEYQDVFLKPIDYLDPDVLSGDLTLISTIEELARSWRDQPIDQVVQRLLRLRRDITDANITWPDRVYVACKGLAEVVTDPMAWFQAVQSMGLLPEGTPFLAAVIKRDEADPGLIDVALANPMLRDTVVNAALATEGVADAIRSRVISDLTPSDHGNIMTLVLRKELKESVLREMLTDSSPEGRGMVAAAMFDPRPREGPWMPPVALSDEWQAAVVSLRPDLMPSNSFYVQQLFIALAASAPDVLVELVKRAVLGAEGGMGVYRSLGHDGWTAIHQLPSTHKLDLWRSFKDQPSAFRMLQQHVVGPSAAWLGEMLDSQEITAGDALKCYRGLEENVPIEELAGMLVPRGIKPMEVANLAMFGTWEGEKSRWYETQRARFDKMREAENPDIRAVGEVGVQMFSEERDAALAEEKLNRIRGRL